MMGRCRPPSTRNPDLPVHRPGGQHAPVGAIPGRRCRRPRAGTTRSCARPSRGPRGTVVKTTGDGMMAVFAGAIDAAAASLAAQRGADRRALGRDRPAPGADGRSTAGEAEQRGGDYFGTTVNRAARIMAAGHGGQVLLSASAGRARGRAAAARRRASATSASTTCGTSAAPSTCTSSSTPTCRRSSRRWSPPGARAPTSRRASPR